ncbi:MAG: hypothetical protein CVU42_13810 [Chloroflexi bacterium HGW-Chloroflexi-4]|jgi:hypothetical protein|nr:MAG: hypothetical protein CVU42_13810 [Chloroflexi bacterium HGW-Chloroflexi-4]
MPLDLKNLSVQNISQLAFDLKVDEIEVTDVVSPAEAQRRSDVALTALKLKFKADQEALERFEAESKVYWSKKIEEKSDEKIPLPVKPNTFGWEEDFFLLMNQGWPWRVAVYIAWAGSPKVGRWPKTQEDLAINVLGLTSDRQISEWRKNNPAIDEMIGIMQAMPLLSHRRDIFEALATSASDPSSKGAQDRKTALTMTGDYVPRLKVEDDRPKTNAKEYTDEELDQAAARLKKKLGIEQEDKEKDDE